MSGNIGNTWVSGDDVVAFVKRCQENCVEVDGPDPVVGFLESDVLIDHRIGEVVLSRRLERPRFRTIETFSARNHLHAFRLSDLSEIDDEFRAWLAEAYRVGEQRHLSN